MIDELCDDVSGDTLWGLQIDKKKSRSVNKSMICKDGFVFYLHWFIYNKSMVCKDCCLCCAVCAICAVCVCLCLSVCVCSDRAVRAVCLWLWRGGGVWLLLCVCVCSWLGMWDLYFLPCAPSGRLCEQDAHDPAEVGSQLLPCSQHWVAVSEWVSEWVRAWVSEWVSACVSEWASERGRESEW